MRINSAGFAGELLRVSSPVGGKLLELIEHDRQAHAGGEIFVLSEIVGCLFLDAKTASWHGNDHKAITRLWGTSNGTNWADTSKAMLCKLNR